MLRSALDHYERQQNLTAAALIAARRRKWRDAQAIAQITALFQLKAAEDALASIDPMIHEQGFDAPPVAQIDVRSLAGTASDGRPLVSLFEQAASPEALGLMVVTQVQDIARAAAGLSIALRPAVDGWVRMLNPPSCSRCVVLAGKFYRRNQGFARHVRCDCRHVPAREDTAGDLRTDPQAYFEAASRHDYRVVENAKGERRGIWEPKGAGSSGDQDRIFTKAGAEAIRKGADIGQVVNARRVTTGMQFAGAPAVKVTPNYFGPGKDRKVTFEGSTKRGVFGKAEIARGAEFEKQGQFMRAKRGRLMPESILMLAKNDAEAIRALKLYGYIR